MNATLPESNRPAGRGRPKAARPSLRREPQPDPAALERAAAVEREPDLGGMPMPELADYLAEVLPGYVHGHSPSREADAPTDAVPGSEEKIKVLQRRVRLGMSVRHPGDKQMDPPDPKESPHEH